MYLHCRKQKLSVCAETVGKVTLVLMCSPGWPQTCNPLASENQVFRLQAFGSISGSNPMFWIFGSECGPMKAMFQEAFLIELLSCEVSKIILASSLSGPRRPISKSLPNEACVFLSLNLVRFYAPAFVSLPPLRGLPCSPVQSSPVPKIPFHRGKNGHCSHTGPVQTPQGLFQSSAEGRLPI